MPETTMAESSMKLWKSEAEEENDGGETATRIDRISDLPDSLLCHILSYLPTRTSVATMNLVSGRWSNLWKHLQVFDLFHNFRNRERFERFKFFVNSVLALRRSRDIRKLHVQINGPMSNRHEVRYSCVEEEWILAAIGPCLEDLCLYIDWYDGIILPPSFLISCTNLVSLRLWGDISVEVKHSSFCLPSLKFLELGYNIVDSEVVFLSGCPKLETLDINFKPENIFLTEVPVPPSSSSKWLKSTNNNFTWSFFKFHTEFRYIQLGIIGNFDSMVEAFLDVFSPSESEYVDPVFDGLLVPDEHILLPLHHSTSKWPLHAPVLNDREFQYLQHLKFILPCFNSNLLVNVLKKCRRLQVLIIQSNMEEPSSFRTWEPLSTTVPICLKSHLTYIRIEGYQGFEDELTFAEYILRNGLVLEKMLIFVDTSMDIMNKYSSVKRLLDIPRGSAKCQLKFDPVVSS